MNNETESPHAAGFYKTTSRKFLPPQPVVFVQCKGQTEAMIKNTVNAVYFSDFLKVRMILKSDVSTSFTGQG